MRKITKKEKILYTIFKMHNDKSEILRYEDILVKVFKGFPEDFQIRFYPEFPDTDSIRRALYQLIPEVIYEFLIEIVHLQKKALRKGKKLLNILMVKIFR